MERTLASAPAAPRLPLALDWSRIVFLILGAILIYLTVVPLFVLLVTSVIGREGLTLAHYAEVLTTPTFQRPVVVTIVAAFGAGTLATLVGVPLAWAVARTDMPGRRLVQFTVIASFVTPPFLGANAWVMLAGPNAGWLNRLWVTLSGVEVPLFNVFSLLGLIFVMFLYTMPFVFIAVSSALELVSSEMEEAAAILGAGWLHRTMQVTFPLVLPAILAGYILAFLETVTVFGTPAMIAIPARMHTVTTEIWTLFNYPPQEGLAAAYALPLLGLTATLLWFQRRLMGRRGFATVAGKGGQRRAVRLGIWKVPMVLFAVMVGVLTIVLPYLQLVVSSLSRAWGRPPTLDNLTLENYRFVLTFEFTTTAIKNSLVLATLSATVATLLAIGIAYVVQRRLLPYPGGLTFLAMAPIVVPSIVLAVALFSLYTKEWLLLYGTIWILFVAYLTKYLPLAFANCNAAIISIHPELEEAARILGASQLRALKDITVPVARAGIVGAWLLVFMPSMRELSSSVLLTSTDSIVISVAIWNLYQEGKLEAVSVLGVLLLVATFIVLAISFKVLGRDILPVQRG
ncbi:MAG: iron ABC transporter permease [Chloroflexi bacterium]|nr:iron ABC transporter permease [Chloroflexota bacterium]